MRITGWAVLYSLSSGYVSGSVSLKQPAQRLGLPDWIRKVHTKRDDTNDISEK